ncbi:MAG: hypothetical protein JSW34_08975 [Candidatus Zixiibacteriota bacterium]|nr:MAG: hypothetical protein JSW34_08975 [candidate division Zixibacteria bacterium]
MLKNIFLCGCIIVMVPPCVWAFDGEREGFVLGFGVGAGAANIERIAWYQTRTDNLYGIYTDLTLGWGMSNRVVIHYAGRQQFAFENDGWYLGFPAFGVSYFRKPEAPSLILMAGVGMMLGLSIESVGTGSAYGVGGAGPYVGVGYEWSKNFAAEFCFGRSLDVLRDALEADHSISWFSVSVHYLAY